MHVWLAVGLITTSGRKLALLVSAVYNTGYIRLKVTYTGRLLASRFDAV